MQMDAGAIRWLHRIVRQNFWRVPSWYEQEDLLNDGVMCWYRTLRRYYNGKGTKGLNRRIGEASDLRHIMALFQRTFLNHIHDLSRLRTKTLTTYISDLVSEEFPSEDAILERVGLVEQPSGDATVNIINAPFVLKRALLSAAQTGNTRNLTRMLRELGVTGPLRKRVDVINALKSQLSLT